MNKKISKRYKMLTESTKIDKSVTIDDAIKMVKKNCNAKFDESIDVSFNLNLKQKKKRLVYVPMLNFLMVTEKKLELLCYAKKTR